MALRGSAIPGVGILGSGIAFPSDGGRWATNEDIHALVYGPDWVRAMAALGRDPRYVAETLGFERRFWVHTPGEPTVHGETATEDLIEIASRAALRDSRSEAADIDLFIVATTTSSRHTSSLATIAGGRLGLRSAAFEMKSGCSSAVYALAIAYRFLGTGARRVLVACGETLSKVATRELAYAVGDAGAAVVLARVEDSRRGLLASTLDADGSLAGLGGVPGELPPTAEAVEAGCYRMQLSTEMEAAARERWPIAPRALLEATGLAPSEVKAYIPNQVNRRIVRWGAEQAKVPAEAVVDRVAEYANCGAASVLVALHDARADGRAAEGQVVLVNAVGGGLAWGGLLLVA